MDMKDMRGTPDEPLRGYGRQIMPTTTVQQTGQMADPAIMELITNHSVAIDVPVGISDLEPREVFNDPNPRRFNPEVLDGNADRHRNCTGTEPWINLHLEHPCQKGHIIEIPACQNLQMGRNSPDQITPCRPVIDFSVSHDWSMGVQ